MPSPGLHASAVVWGEDGILIRGPSGSGKTTLVSAFIREGHRCNVFSGLVADDLVLLRSAGGRLVARPHARIAGLMEHRGVGIVSVDHEAACVVRLVIDLEAAPARLPDPEALLATLCDITLPRLVIPKDAPASDNVYRAIEFLAAFKARS